MEKLPSESKKSGTRKVKKSASSGAGGNASAGGGGKKGGKKGKGKKVGANKTAETASSRIEKLAQPKQLPMKTIAEEPLAGKLNVKLNAKAKVTKGNKGGATLSRS